MISDKYDTAVREALESDTSTSGFLSRFLANTDDLREAVSFLIHRRELLRDCEIEQLEHACDELLKQVSDLKRQMLLEELSCFKEVLRLYRQLSADHDQS